MTNEKKQKISNIADLVTSRIVAIPLVIAALPPAISLGKGVYEGITGTTFSDEMIEDMTRDTVRGMVAGSILGAQQGYSSTEFDHIADNSRSIQILNALAGSIIVAAIETYVTPAARLTGLGIGSLSRYIF